MGGADDQTDYTFPIINECKFSISTLVGECRCWLNAELLLSVGCQRNQVGIIPTGMI